MNKEENETYEEKLKRIEAENNAKIDRYSKYQQAYATAHGRNMPAPIVKDKEGQLHWLNRKQRRAQKKNKK